MNNYVLLNGDCYEELDKIENKSVQLICIDPPYNIKKAEWDDIPNYQEWLIKIIDKLLLKLKDNGSFFIFHNDMPILSRLMINIEENFKLLKFKQMIVWNKNFVGCPNKGFMDGFIVKNYLTNWNKMAEYILFYTFDNTYKLKEARINLGISALTIAKENLSKNGNLTGWYSNIELGKNYPTKENMKIITKYLKLEYDEIVPKFYNQKTHHSIWNYMIAKRSKIHITPKPIDLLKNIILHTTDENDLVLDCFAGTGSFGIASLQLNRKPILIEKNKIYFDEIIKTLNKEV